MNELRTICEALGPDPLGVTDPFEGYAVRGEIEGLEDELKKTRVEIDEYLRALGLVK